VVEVDAIGANPATSRLLRPGIDKVRMYIYPLKPVMPGHEIMSVTTVAFLIENGRLGKKALFDLGDEERLLEFSTLYADTDRGGDSWCQG
jgi:hypothetical protein